MIFLRRQRRLLTWCGAVCLFVASFGLTSGMASAALPAGQVVFLLEYIGSDYEIAVRDGEIANAFEYAEMLDFARLVQDEYRLLRPGQAGVVAQRLHALRTLVLAKRPAAEVQAAVRALVPLLSEDLGVEAWPDRSPDAARGRRLYEEQCGRCHGAAGGGDGVDARGLEPPATSFLEPRMERVSVNQIAGAIRYGIQGTPMPAYGDAWTAEEIWDVAFHVASLRKPRRERVVPTAVVASPVTDDSALASAHDLESAFLGVADRVFPSVVGVTALAADASAAPSQDGRTTSAGGWSRWRGVRARHPGFAPVGEGSGFFVESDGTVLTALHLIRDPKTGRPADRIEVELGDDRRALARVLGLEPMIDLAVLKIDVPYETPPIAIGDSEKARVGQWVIALGDPTGIERMFVAGSLSATPRRECYQEEPAETLYQTSLWIEAGGFGGPVVDLSGRVIGMAQPRPGLVPLPGVPSVLRVLPIELALTIYESLATSAREVSPWLGFAVLELSRDLRKKLGRAPRTGIFIDDVYAPSPASKAGIRAGDVLVSMEGNRLLSVADFQRWLYLFGVGKPVTAVLYREGAEITKTLTIEQRPSHLVP